MNTINLNRHLVWGIKKLHAHKPLIVTSNFRPFTTTSLLSNIFVIITIIQNIYLAMIKINKQKQGDYIKMRSFPRWRLSDSLLSPGEDGIVVMRLELHRPGLPVEILVGGLLRLLLLLEYGLQLEGRPARRPVGRPASL